ncbi:MAG: phosphopantetheine-binding protein [Bacteroidales bacterium]|nr:phosphopantetheine-binding protein [Bacteroidales bacterium]
MEELILKLKSEIIEALNLEEMSVDDIDSEAPLFIEGLGLDSIDALELTVLLEKKYALKIQTADEGKKILYSVKSMAEYISQNKK